MPHTGTSSTYLGLRSIDELVNYTYNRTPDEIMKAGFSTTDPGVDGNYNPLFGAMAWANFNLEANIFAALPKYVWDFSGWRIFSAKAGLYTPTTALAEFGGTEEGGAIAPAIKPDVEEVTVKPKTLQYVFEASELLEQLVDNSRDDNYGSLAQQRVYASDQFKERVNLMLNRIPGDVSADDLSQQLDLESLDRIVASFDEYTFEAHTTVIDNYDPWRLANGNKIDRATDDTYDATVTSPSGAIGTADVLTDAVLRSVLADVRIAGGKEPTVFIGGQDTYAEVQSIYMNAYRIQNTADLRTEFSVGVNGVDTFTGTGAGLHISTVYGLPYIPSKDTSQSAEGSVDNLLILNTSADKNAPNKPLIGIQVLKPIVYYEAGKRQQGYPFINEAFNDRALYNMLAETTCRNFKAQGKIRDISSGI